jgi:type IX secretion system PorP/SprF family membrane protein
MKKKSLYIILVLLLSQRAEAQQDAIYSQYMFNPFMVNPAYAGSRDALSGVLLFRQQWAGIEGAPATQTFSMHSGIGKTKLAAGLNLVNDAIGPTRNSGIFLTGAYHLKLAKGKLSFGLRGGVYNSRLDNSLLRYDITTDKFNTQNVVSTLIPSFDAGLYYYTRKFYIGGSVTHLTQSKFEYDSYPSGTNLFLKRHYMIASGYAAEITPKVVFKPSVLVKYVDGAPINFDINASFLFNKIFWLGSSFRSGNGITFISEFYITEWFRVGYSYDLVLNRLKKFTLGTHEIVAGFDLNLKKVNHISPRYL